MDAVRGSDRWIDGVVGSLLGCASLWVLLVTDQMGFVRDEAFYFNHAEIYQDWQVEVEAGGERREKALQRDELQQTWRNNAEHPPLNKLMLGWSWRLFGRKLREVSVFRQGTAEEGAVGVLVADVHGLGPAQGFEVGAAVRLLRPQRVGEPPDVVPRVLGAGRVLQREKHRALVALEEPAALAQALSPTEATAVADVAAIAVALRRGCGAAGQPADDGVLRRTGCELVEARPTYWLSESQAMRMPGMLFGALLVSVLYWFTRGALGGRPQLTRPFALVASVGYLCLPHAFFHAHLAVFDTTISALLIITTLAYHQSLDSRRWAVLAALLWGLSLLAKHNAFFLPVALIGHWLWDAIAEGRIRWLWRPAAVGAGWRGRLAGWLARPHWAAVLAGVALAGLAALGAPLLGAGAALLVLAGGPWRLQLPPLPLAWFLMVPIGLLLLVIGWPLLWHDTLDNLFRWLEFHLHHEHYMQTYFGKVLAYPPFPVDLPFTLTALTWAPTLLFAFAVGALLLLDAALRRHYSLARQIASRLYRPQLAADAPEALEGPRSVTTPVADPLDGADVGARSRSLDRLMILSALWPIVLIALPSTPVFGGTKHWMAAYPAMLWIGARGAQWLWVAACQPWLQRDEPGPRRAAALLNWALAALLLVPAVATTAEYHPVGTMAYNVLIGGAPGAAHVDLQRQFWGHQTRAGLETVNALAPPGARVWFHKCAWGAFQMYVREGWFRRDLVYSGTPNDSTFGFYHHQYDHDDYELELFDAWGQVAPAKQFSIQGVPYLSVYQRRSAAATGSAAPAADESARRRRAPSSIRAENSGRMP